MRVVLGARAAIGSVYDVIWGMAVPVAVASAIAP
jgi:hypothetical protein